jgi:hypothetical protein
MFADEGTKKMLTGKVVKTSLGGDSKSAHQGFVLQQENSSVKLRRQGGNPFYDGYFERFEGRDVQVEGYDMEQYFLVSNIKVV